MHLCYPSIVFRNTIHFSSGVFVEVLMSMVVAFFFFLFRFRLAQGLNLVQVRLESSFPP